MTIRGYTFNVGDNVTLDQTKVQKTAAEGGDFAWLYATYQAERTGDRLRDVLEPPAAAAAPRGEQGPDPLATAFLKDPYPIRPAVKLRMPRFHLRQVGDARRATRPTSLANYFAARDGAEFPYQAIPEREQGYLAEPETEHPDYLGRGLADDDQGVAVHPVPRDRPVQADRRRRRWSTAPTSARSSPRFRPGYLESGSPTRAGWSPTRRCRRTSPRTAPPQLPVPKTFENQPLDMVQAIRDTLLNYVNAVEQQLAAGTKPAARRGQLRPRAGRGIVVQADWDLRSDRLQHADATCDADLAGGPGLRIRPRGLGHLTLTSRESLRTLRARCAVASGAVNGFAG